MSYIANAFSKPLSGLVFDTFRSPKWLLITTFGLSVLLTLAIVFFPYYMGFAICFSAIKFLSSFGRIGALKIIAQWWPLGAMGLWTGLLNSLGANVGEGSSRFILTAVLDTLGKENWMVVFYIAAAIGSVCAIPLLIFGKDRPSAALPGLARHASSGKQQKKSSQQQRANGRSSPVGSTVSSRSTSVERGQGTESQATITATPEEIERSFFKETVVPLFLNPRFYFIASLAFATTAARETIVSLSNFYMRFVFGFPTSKSGAVPVVYNISASMASIIGGIILDRVPKNRRGIIMIAFLLLATCGYGSMLLFTMTRPTVNVAAGESLPQSDMIIAFLLIGFASFSISAPNGFLDGVFAVELAGPQGVAFCSGIIGGVGYFGSAITQSIYGPYTKTHEGWIKILWITVGLCAASAALATAYWVLGIWSTRRAKKNYEKSGNKKKRVSK